MVRPISHLCLLIFIVALTACSTDSGPDNQANEVSQTGSIEAEAVRDGVFIIRDETREVLPVEEPLRLNVGEGVAVDEDGRVTFRLADLLTAELLQSGEITLQELAPNDRPTAMTIRQNGGMLLGDFNPDQLSSRRLTIQSQYGTVTTTGTRFLLVQEASTALEWIVNLGSAEDEMQVTAAEMTRTVAGSTARWVATDGAVGERVEVDTRRLRAWFNNAQSGQAELALSEVILSPANLIADTGSLTALPRMGQAFELLANEQGAVKLTLDPIGLFGDPQYSLEDCNGDGSQDIAIQAGKLQFDFRPLLARTLALDVTVINRDQPGLGALWALDPAGNEVDRDLLEVGSNQSATLSLHSEQFYHAATVAMSNGCFLGFSLMPPSATGAPGEPRAAATTQPSDEVVNILATPGQARPEVDQIEAVPVNASEEAGSIQIDGEPGDWDALTAKSGLDWTSFDAVTYDAACANRFPDAVATATDLSGQVRFAYDERFLYVAFRVDDDGYVGYSADDQNLFLGDSPQLSLDMDLLGDFNDGRRNQDDWQIDFQPDFEAPRVALWQLGSLSSRPFDEEAMVAAAPTATGYFLEAALPWESFETSLQPGDRLGLAANINDNDTPGSNVQECIISTAPQREWDDPTTWGTLLLRPSG